MQLENGRQVKIIFKNGLSIEGIVEEWNEDQTVLFGTSCRLKSFDGNSLLLVRNTDEIIAIKIMLTPEDTVDNKDNNCGEKQKNMKDLEVEEEQLEFNFEQVYDQEGKLNVKKLAELRQDVMKTEKQIIANKLRQHYIADSRGVQYGNPGFFKKQSTE